ncbi:protein kinase family protein [Striga asiatica]|uniref:Protein kinase family protein n=1 Tax=Striga asiatica TaxID=4170 RepID=A0A5A7PME5_STRAF|nr:protein kinase family protein [Striga asiatica]
MAIQASEPARNPNSSPRSAPNRHSTKTPNSQTQKPSSSSSQSNTQPAPLSDPFRSRSSATSSSSSSSYRLDTSVATNSVASRASLSSLRDTLPESTQIYDFSEIRAATNNFLAKRLSASSQSWRCSLNGKDAAVFQRKLRKSVSESDVLQKLAVISRSHFTSIVKLLGVSISGEHIYLAYEFVRGSDLESCLRNKLNPNFTVLSNWMSRIQIATDVAHGLDYIHSTAGLGIDMVHKHVKSSGILVADPSLNARICHFGAAELCGETEGGGAELDGVRGYMSPEFRVSGLATQKSDVYAFGVVILELMTGQEPVRYRFDRSSGNQRLISVIETAREAVGGGEREEQTAAVEGRLRRWVDKRLGDSFPVEVAERMVRVALQCVQEDPDKRPEMKWVAGKISKLYLASKVWADRVKVPTEISVSLAPR